MSAYSEDWSWQTRNDFVLGSETNTRQVSYHLNTGGLIFSTSLGQDGRRQCWNTEKNPTTLFARWGRCQWWIWLDCTKREKPFSGKAWFLIWLRNWYDSKNFSHLVRALGIHIARKWRQYEKWHTKESSRNNTQKLCCPAYDSLMIMKTQSADIE